MSRFTGLHWADYPPYKTALAKLAENQERLAEIEVKLEALNGQAAEKVEEYQAVEGRQLAGMDSEADVGAARKAMEGVETLRDKLRSEVAVRQRTAAILEKELTRLEAEARVPAGENLRVRYAELLRSLRIAILAAVEANVPVQEVGLIAATEFPMQFTEPFTYPVSAALPGLDFPALGPRRIGSTGMPYGGQVETWLEAVSKYLSGELDKFLPHG